MQTRQVAESVADRQPHKKLQRDLQDGKRACIGGHVVSMFFELFVAVKRDCRVLGFRCALACGNGRT